MYRKYKIPSENIKRGSLTWTWPAKLVPIEVVPPGARPSCRPHRPPNSPKQRNVLLTSRILAFVISITVKRQYFGSTAKIVARVPSDLPTRSCNLLLWVRMDMELFVWSDPDSEWLYFAGSRSELLSIKSNFCKFLLKNVPFYLSLHAYLLRKPWKCLRLETIALCEVLCTSSFLIILLAWFKV